MEAEAAKANDAMKLLEDLLPSLKNKPKPFNVAEFLKGIDDNYEACVQLHASIRSHLAGYTKLIEQRTRFIKDGKDDWFRDRDGVGGKLKDNGVYKGLSKVLADGYVASICCPAKYGLNFVVNTDVIDVVDASTTWDSCALVKVPDPSIEEPKQQLRNEMRKWLEANRTNIDAAIKANVGRAEETNRKATVTTFKPGSTALLLPDSAFSIHPAISTLVYTKADLVSDARLCSWVVKGFRAVVSALSGSFLVMTIPPAVVLEHADLNEWLRRCESTDLAACSTWVLNEGDHLYIAFGHVPIFVHFHPKQLAKQPRGPQKSVDKKKPVHPWNSLGTIGVSVLLDSVKDPAHGHELVTHVKTQYDMASSWIPTDIKEEIAKTGWLGELGESTPVSVDGAAPELPNQNDTEA